MTAIRNVLVTGGARRIGRAIALGLARDGWGVAIHCRESREEAADLAQEIAAGGGRAVVCAADLADAKALAPLIENASLALGGLTALVNNASLFEADEIDTLTPESWSAHLDINLRAPIFLAQAFAKQLPKGETGAIINLIDQRVLKPNPLFFSYSVSKSALWWVTRTMAQALAPRIRVNAIGPGPVLPTARMDEAVFEKQRGLTPLGRGPAPEEIFAAARFILAQSAMTGAMIVLDGGQHLTWETPDVVEVRE
jgi:NAD(P)-dependent dehydrogenase (short-subunit alcohol dehydrogenase family)